MESRVEMHEAQITKMQKALEQADQERARVEEDLEVALRAMQSIKTSDSDQQVRAMLYICLQRLFSDENVGSGALSRGCAESKGVRCKLPKLTRL